MFLVLPIRWSFLAAQSRARKRSHYDDPPLHVWKLISVSSPNFTPNRERKKKTLFLLLLLSPYQSKPLKSIPSMFGKMHFSVKESNSNVMHPRVRTLRGHVQVLYWCIAWCFHAPFSHWKTHPRRVRTKRACPPANGSNAAESSGRFRPACVPACARRFCAVDSLARKVSSF